MELDRKRLCYALGWMFVIIMMLYMHCYKLGEIPYGLNVDEAGIKISYETGEYGNISIELEGDGKEHTIYVRYSEPFVFRVGEVISLLTLLCIGIYTLWVKRHGSIYGLL